MVYRATVKNGRIVVEDGIALPEGARLRIEPDESPETPALQRGSVQAISKYAGIWAEQDADIERSLNELRQMKQDELRRQLSEPEEEL